MFNLVGTSVGMTLVAAGTILRFAVSATFTRSLNVHVAGVIVMLAGIVAQDPTVRSMALRPGYVPG
jgi:hypothetical protein